MNLSTLMRSSENALLAKAGKVLDVITGRLNKERNFELVGGIAFVNDPNEICTGYLYRMVDDKMVRTGFICDRTDLEDVATAAHVRAVVELAAVCGIVSVQVVSIGRLHASALTGEIVKSR